MKVREYPMMRIRVSPELKDKILQAASAESRTQNSEICHQLEKAYGLKTTKQEDK
ncbi:hypothetical protein ACRN98_23525 [Shewanella oncorhynchi]|uniref:hypothetical protein n=1 Tax=Shewanella TaxID=22 RepID=UPI0021DA01C0|nr:MULTISPECIES: hypothetical protein [unclassified Shewanella]MCU7965173.1 hypothetical protein [Shewanella sp. SW32]MCU7973163.1 hypothetical protein [Shewanella sp. SW29]MCU8036926.1 hypothetical protein [Shewanella sp. SM69]